MRSTDWTGRPLWATLWINVRPSVPYWSTPTDQTHCYSLMVKPSCRKKVWLRETCSLWQRMPSPQCHSSNSWRSLQKSNKSGMWTIRQQVGRLKSSASGGTKFLRWALTMATTSALLPTYGIGLDWPAWWCSVADSSQVPEQILEWNRERTANRSAKVSANWRYCKLRKQNDATTLLALACRPMPYAVFSSLFYFAHLLYRKTVLITTISKCTKGTGKSMSRIVSRRCYALTFAALVLISSVDTIRSLS